MIKKSVLTLDKQTAILIITPHHDTNPTIRCKVKAESRRSANFIPQRPTYGRRYVSWIMNLSGISSLCPTVHMDEWSQNQLYERNKSFVHPLLWYENVIFG